jgi:hypothetical protein
MIIILIILAAVFIAVLALHAYKQYKLRVEKRIEQNEYDAAVTVWEYARIVKSQIDEALRMGAGVIDFSKITVPHTNGYEMSLELIGTYFRVYAVPGKYGNSGRLSFTTDNTLTVRAGDHTGERALTEDPEYK